MATLIIRLLSRPDFFFVVAGDACVLIISFALKPDAAL
jgi:hypothetical protein